MDYIITAGGRKQQTSFSVSINHRNKWPDIYCRGSFVAARELAVETGYGGRGTRTQQYLPGDINTVVT